MNFYTQQHAHYCGIDLHRKKMYLFIINKEGEILLHKNIDTNPDIFMTNIQPFRDDLTFAIEFTSSNNRIAIVFEKVRH